MIQLGLIQWLTDSRQKENTSSPRTPLTPGCEEHEGWCLATGTSTTGTTHTPVPWGWICAASTDLELWAQEEAARGEICHTIFSSILQKWTLQTRDFTLSVSSLTEYQCRIMGYKSSPLECHVSYLLQFQVNWEANGDTMLEPVSLTLQEDIQQHEGQLPTREEHLSCQYV